MKTRIYAVAEKVPEWDRDVVPGNPYPIVGESSITFTLSVGDEARRVEFTKSGREYSWTRLELRDVDPRDVAALIEAAEWAADVLGMCAQAEHETDAHDNLVTVLNKIKGDE